jgi:hypothetical protein
VFDKSGVRALEFGKASFLAIIVDMVFGTIDEASLREADLPIPV